MQMKNVRLNWLRDKLLLLVKIQKIGQRGDDFKANLQYKFNPQDPDIQKWRTVKFLKAFNSELDDFVTIINNNQNKKPLIETLNVKTNSYLFEDWTLKRNAKKFAKDTEFPIFSSLTLWYLDRGNMLKYKRFMVKNNPIKGRLTVLSHPVTSYLYDTMPSSHQTIAQK
jgi:hypothetical protein